MQYVNRIPNPTPLRCEPFYPPVCKAPASSETRAPHVVATLPCIPAVMASYFNESNGASIVGLTPNFPGKVIPLPLQSKGTGYRCKDGAYFASTGERGGGTGELTPCPSPPSRPAHMPPPSRSLQAPFTWATTSTAARPLAASAARAAFVRPSRETGPPSSRPWEPCRPRGSKRAKFSSSTPTPLWRGKRRSRWGFVRMRIAARAAAAAKASSTPPSLVRPPSSPPRSPFSFVRVLLNVLQRNFSRYF